VRLVEGLAEGTLDAGVGADVCAGTSAFEGVVLDGTIGLEGAVLFERARVLVRVRAAFAFLGAVLPRSP